MQQTVKLPRGRRVHDDSAFYVEHRSNVRGHDWFTVSKIGKSPQFISQRMILTQGGKPVGAIVPLEDLSLLEQSEDLRDASIYRAALKKAHKEKTLDWDALKKELGL